MRRNAPPYPSTFLASVLVLTLLGGFAQLLFQGQALLQGLRESVAVVVELSPQVSQAQAEAVGDFLQIAPYVRPSSSRYISREEGARLLKEEYGEDVLESGLENPLYDLFQFYLDESFLESGREQEMISQLRDLPGVLDVYVKENLVAQVAGNARLLGYAGSLIAAFLLVSVIFLIVNTTKLALLSRANLIRNMELVGASWAFIARPFLYRSILLGFSSGVLAALLTFLLGQLAERQLPDLWVPIDPLKSSTLVLGLVALSILVHLGATFFVVRRTLQLRVDDLAVLRS